MTTYYMHTLDGKRELVLCSGQVSPDGSMFRVSMSGEITPKKIKNIIRTLSFVLEWVEKDIALEQEQASFQSAADLYV